LCFTVDKIIGWGTFPKCRAGLVYHLALGPLFWECTPSGALPYPKKKSLNDQQHQYPCSLPRTNNHFQANCTIFIFQIYWEYGFLWDFKNHVLLRGKKGVEKINPSYQCVFFSGKFSQLSKEENKRKVQKIY